MSRAAASAYVHATALLVGEAGILIQGRSGAGKTSLALALLGAAGIRGCFARLVADDRLALQASCGRLIARPHPALAGLVERRGIAIMPIEHEAACVLQLVVDLGTDLPDRCPAEPPAACLLGVKLPVLNLLATAGAGENMIRIFDRLAAL
jgi:HPr kinase/phosphorylase